MNGSSGTGGGERDEVRRVAVGVAAGRHDGHCKRCLVNDPEAPRCSRLSLALAWLVPLVAKKSSKLGGRGRRKHGHGINQALKFRVFCKGPPV